MVSKIVVELVLIPVEGLLDLCWYIGPKTHGA